MNSSPAAGLIKEKVRQSGPMDFASFLDCALYDPTVGYYGSGKAAIGRGGDFYTNVSVGAIYGEVLAIFLRTLFGRLTPLASGSPVLLEQGANDGTLAADLCAVLPDIPYWIVEPLPALRKRQEEKLAPWASRVRWFQSLEEVPAFSGVHLSNELIDAIPFHLVERDGDGWLECRVAGSEDGEPAFHPSPVTDPELQRSLSFLPNDLPCPYRTEIRPRQRTWLASLAARMERGYVLACDYGFPADSYYHPERQEGTLQCYQNHRKSTDPLLDIGDKDISAHVDFTALARDAGEEGFALAGYADQHHFLVGAAESWLRAMDGQPEAAKKLRRFATLIHPETMGRQFKHILFGRGLPNSALEGLPGLPGPGASAGRLGLAAGKL